MIPRDYQRAAVDAAHAQTAAHGNTMLVLPTGAGKSAIAGFYIVETVERQRDARVGAHHAALLGMSFRTVAMMAARFQQKFK